MPNFLAKKLVLRQLSRQKKQTSRGPTEIFWRADNFSLKNSLQVQVEVKLFSLEFIARKTMVVTNLVKEEQCVRKSKTERPKQSGQIVQALP